MDDGSWRELRNKVAGVRVTSYGNNHISVNVPKTEQNVKTIEEYFRKRNRYHLKSMGDRLEGGQLRTILSYTTISDTFLLTLLIIILIFVLILITIYITFF